MNYDIRKKMNWTSCVTTYLCVKNWNLNLNGSKDWEGETPEQVLILIRKDHHFFLSATIIDFDSRISRDFKKNKK